MSRSRKDSRFRTVQRENGRAFCVWFDAKFRQPDASGIEVGQEVELLAGSTMQVAVIRSLATQVTESWPFLGVLGGQARYEKVRGEWDRVQEELGNPAPVLPESMKLPVVEHTPRKAITQVAGIAGNHAATMASLRQLAADYGLKSSDMYLRLSFKAHDGTSSFTLAARKRGMEVDAMNDKEVLVRLR